MTKKMFHKKYCCLADKVKGCLGRKENCNGIEPLSETFRSGKVKICKVTGDRKLCSRMASLGVLPGHEAEIICPEKGSNCLLKIHGGTLSLDHHTTKNILVSSV
ncbi:MAG: ferrous iron transport protein A [Thermodesulfobacteriota bacterium]